MARLATGERSRSACGIRARRADVTLMPLRAGRPTSRGDGQLGRHAAGASAAWARRSSPSSRVRPPIGAGLAAGDVITLFADAAAPDARPDHARLCRAPGWLARHGRVHASGRPPRRGGGAMSVLHRTTNSSCWIRPKTRWSSSRAGRPARPPARMAADARVVGHFRSGRAAAADRHRPGPARHQPLDASVTALLIP